MLIVNVTYKADYFVEYSSHEQLVFIGFSVMSNANKIAIDL